MRGWLQGFWLGSLAVVLSGCGGNSSRDGNVDLLDPAQPQYGKTYSEWATEWASYTYRPAPPGCASPFADESGQDCQLYQDPASPVFFLVGVFGGGLAHRNACPIPKDKALFFPLLDAMGDNAGLPPQDLRPDSDLLNYMTESFKHFDPSQLWLIVDGRRSHTSSAAAYHRPGMWPHSKQGKTRWHVRDFPRSKATFRDMSPAIGRCCHRSRPGNIASSSGQRTRQRAPQSTPKSSMSSTRSVFRHAQLALSVLGAGQGCAAAKAEAR